MVARLVAALEAVARSLAPLALIALAQYLLAEDVLGYARGHKPRHAGTYRDFRAEYDCLEAERVAALGEFKANVASGA